MHGQHIDTNPDILQGTLTCTLSHSPSCQLNYVGKAPPVRDKPYFINPSLPHSFIPHLIVSVLHVSSVLFWILSPDSPYHSELNLNPLSRTYGSTPEAYFSQFHHAHHNTARCLWVQHVWLELYAFVYPSVTTLHHFLSTYLEKLSLASQTVS